MDYLDKKEQLLFFYNLMHQCAHCTLKYQALTYTIEVYMTYKGETYGYVTT